MNWFKRRTLYHIVTSHKKAIPCKIKYLVVSLLSALMLCMGAFSVAAYASTGGGITANEESSVEAVAITENINESMTVNAVWLNEEMLRIDVTDLATGTVSSLAIRLSEFVSDTDNSPYILMSV